MMLVCSLLCKIVAFMFLGGCECALRSCKGWSLCLSQLKAVCCGKRQSKHTPLCKLIETNIKNTKNLVFFKYFIQ